MSYAKSKFEKEQQEFLFADVDLDAELLPIAPDGDEVRLGYLSEKIRRCEEELIKLQHLILGKGSEEGTLMRTITAIEELQATMGNVLVITAHLDKMLVEGLKTRGERHSSDIEYLKDVLDEHDTRITELERK